MKLLVIVNPFAAPLAASGACTALCSVDPKESQGYIGARTVAQPAKDRSSALSFGGKPMQRDKVLVIYQLAPVKINATPLHRKRVRDEAVFVCDGSEWESLEAAARVRLDEFIAAGGLCLDALTKWREQGLEKVADMISPLESGPAASPPQLVQGNELEEVA